MGGGGLSTVDQHTCPAPPEEVRGHAQCQVESQLIVNGVHDRLQFGIDAPTVHPRGPTRALWDAPLPKVGGWALRRPGGRLRALIG